MNESGDNPATVAVTVYVPVWVFAVNTGLTVPVESVSTVSVAAPPKVPDAPVVGALNTTGTPDTGSP